MESVVKVLCVSNPPVLTKPPEHFQCNPPQYFTYISSLDPEFECPVCSWPLVSPQTHDCGNSFCGSCCVSLQSCPLCRGTEGFRPCKVRGMLNYLDKREVTCNTCKNTVIRGSFEYHYNNDCKIPCPNGCGETTSRSEFPNHWEQCAKTEVSCPYPKCGSTFPREQYSTHARECDYHLEGCPHCKKLFKKKNLSEHVSDCDEAIVDCPSSCPEKIPKKLLGDHSLTCPEQMINCSAGEIGCPYQGKRKTMTQHESQCTLILVLPTIIALKKQVTELSLQIQEIQNQTNTKSKSTISSKPNQNPQFPQNQINANTKPKTLKSKEKSSKPQNTPPRIPGDPVTFVDTGARVKRGKDWHWGNQDGDSLGVIIGDGGTSADWARVKWDSSSSNCYEVGANGKYSLAYAP